MRLLIRGIKVISLLSVYNLTHLTGNYCQPDLTSNRLLQSDMLLWCSKNSSSALSILGVFFIAVKFEKNSYSCELHRSGQHLPLVKLQVTGHGSTYCK